MELAEHIGAREILFIHLEEYWNKSHDDYQAIAEEHAGIRFAFDGMAVHI
jgi:phosphoribosyl 1,2-cyclic phosphate phosphodiesterase